MQLEEEKLGKILLTQFLFLYKLEIFFKSLHVCLVKLNMESSYDTIRSNTMTLVFRQGISLSYFKNKNSMLTAGF